MSLYDSPIIQKDLDDIYNRKYLNASIFNNTTVLLTGAYGMLASYLVLFFAYLKEKKGINVMLVSLVRNKHKFEIKFGENFLSRFRFEIIESSLLDEINYQGDVDYIIHAASLANPQKYATNPVEVIEPNIIGTYNMLKLAKEKNVKSFLFFSSGDVYGHVEDSGKITETTLGQIDPLAVRSCYGESKRAGEMLCMAFYREYGVPIKIARIGHTYAPTMDINNDSRIFASMIRCLINNEDIVMTSDGSAMRPFCYITDAISAYILLLCSKKNGEAFNICNTKEFLSVLEFAETVASLDENNSIKVVRRERDSNDTYVEDRVNIANCPVEDKLVELGWAPRITTREGVSNVYNYLKGMNNEKN